MVMNMGMDEFFSDENIVILQQLTFAGITAAAQMALFGVLNGLASAATTVAERESIALENEFA